MRQIRDDPIIRCIERTGYPPWFQNNSSVLIGCETEYDFLEEDEDDVQSAE